VLILVRHAMPAHGPDTPARDWVLAPPGREAARELCSRLPARARLVASSEPKAIGTLEAAGTREAAGCALKDPRFDEVVRVEAYSDDFRTQRLAYVEGLDHADWEARGEVVARFGAGVADHLAAADGQPLVIATHGMAMTLWLTATIGLDDPGAFWAELRFPDARVVDLAARTVVRLGSSA
jgi:broad specificity phosphatase PhoE